MGTMLCGQPKAHLGQLLERDLLLWRAAVAPVPPPGALACAARPSKAARAGLLLRELFAAPGR